MNAARSALESELRLRERERRDKAAKISVLLQAQVRDRNYY
jgi:hypothetical protein